LKIDIHRVTSTLIKCHRETIHDNKI